MELVRGELLGRTPSFETVTRDTFVRGGPPLALLDALGIARGVAAALAHMHAAGVIHGDVYAHNTLVCRTDSSGGATAVLPKLGDLGAAWAAPPSLLAAAVRLETRAFGCFLEDLLGLCCGGEPADEAKVEAGPVMDRGGLHAQLERLAAACLSEEVDARPTVAEAADVLRRLGHGSELEATS
jgi:serine/threonine protein kinase